MFSLPHYHAESIYNLIPKDIVVPPKAARYHSKYPGVL